MNHLKKVTNYMWVILMVAITIACCFCFSAQLSAEENAALRSEISAKISTANDIECKVIGGNGVISAYVRRLYTFVSKPVQVYVYIYSSEDYYEDYSDMNLREWKYEAEFKRNDSLTLGLRTYGQQLYWRVIVKSCRTGNVWEIIFDSTSHRDGEGNVIN